MKKRGIAEMRNVYKIWLGSLQERDHSQGLSVDGMIILKWISRE
jgi:hypothetical protein